MKIRTRFFLDLTPFPSPLGEGCPIGRGEAQQRVKAELKNKNLLII